MVGCKTILENDLYLWQVMGGSAERDKSMGMHISEAMNVNDGPSKKVHGHSDMKYSRSLFYTDLTCPRKSEAIN